METFESPCTMVLLATSHIAHKCNQLNHVTLPISMLRFKTLLSIKIALKLSYFCKKKLQNFRALGTPPTDPRDSGGRGLCPQTSSLRKLGLRPQTPKLAPPFRVSGYAPAKGWGAKIATNYQY